jgi:hypothetical protein
MSKNKKIYCRSEIISLLITHPPMKRRNIITLIGASTAALTLATLPGLRQFCGGKALSNSRKRNIKISPIPGVSYTPTALAFMERARFENPRQAIYGMKDPSVRFIIEYVHA